MKATLVLTNGLIYTMDPNRPLAGGIAIRGNRIIAVGDDPAALRGLLADGGEWIDLGGRCVTPGLVDAHVHFSHYARFLQQVDLLDVTTFAQTAGRIRTKAAEGEPGQWLEGRGWTTEIFPGNRFPTAADLDRLVDDRPVAISDHSGHASWVNTRALRRAGITAGTNSPPGGEIQKDADGRPTGVLFENAMGLVSDLIPNPTTDQLAAAMRVAQERSWASGLTGLHDFDGPSCFRALQQLHRAGDLGLRVVKNIPARYVKQATAVGLQSGFGDRWLRIGGVKIFADGAMGPRTALMIEPYENEPENRGIVVTDKEEMKEIASRASAHGLSVTVHAIGDRANHDILDVYEAVRAEEAERGVPSSRLRHRIEHVQIIHPDDQPRLARLNVIASMQPLHATSDMIIADKVWGDRARHSYAWRTMLDTGATLVFGSDAPIEPIEPLKGIYAAVTRRRPDGTGGPDGWYPEQKLTMAETIRAFTSGAAVTSSQEAVLGSVTPGKLADLTIYDRDIFTVPHDELAETEISGTVVDGIFKYRDL